MNNEDELMSLSDRLKNNNIPFVLFREPDLYGQATSIAACGPEAARLFSSLPLALKEFGRQEVMKVEMT